MKKLFLFFLLLIMPLSVDASNNIYSINIDVNIKQDGSADITEVWDVDGDDGTEWYKVISNLGNSQLSNYKVSMDGNALQYKSWNVNESLTLKKGFYGINYIADGLELCFGKYDYNRHVFTLSYTLSNFVFNTNDSQILYFKFIDRLSNVNFDNFKVTVSSYYDFPDTLDVWGYGYEGGYAYVSNGKIEMSNEKDMDGNYVVLLVKFPLNTFNTVNSYSNYSSFEDVYSASQKGVVNGIGSKILSFIVDNIIFIFVLIYVIIQIILSHFTSSLNTLADMRKYGYTDNKKVDKKNVPMFRDIPCNKNIYYANALIKLNNFSYKEGNILGAIILKWIRDDKISFKNEKVGVFNKDTSVIDLTRNVSFDNDLETKLFDMMRAASKDGMLEAKEFERWSRSNYSKFLSLFNRFVKEEIDRLKESGRIYKRTYWKECKSSNVMDDVIYEDSTKLYGLKKYLEEFSRMDTKEVMEVKLWDEYLMFAYLFGIADKVAKQLKDLYPEILEQSFSSTGGMIFDYNTLVFVNNISVRTVSAASAARSAAQSYSSGGGGFSSGGGGGGSFGGGGGGSR